MNQNKIENNSQKRHPKSIFAAKMLFVLAAILCVIMVVDKKKIFNPKSTFRDVFVNESFEKIIKYDTLDVCMFGNSHLGNGIDCHIVSNCLGVTCFNYFQSGTDLQDVYYALYNVLSQTDIKVAVIETYCMTDVRLSELKEGKNKYPSFKMLGTKTKLISMFDLFEPEQYPAAWSNTLRNHDFLFRDTAQIHKNLYPYIYKKPNTVYLGSSGNNKPAINDSLDAVYDSLGPILDGAKVRHDEFDVEYFNKIIELCKEHHVEPVFLTLPEYYKNVKNYGQWKKVINELIGPSKCAWLDLQQNYDSTLFKKDFFEKSRNVNQHLTAQSMPCMSTKLAEFLKDSIKTKLPNRSNHPNWKRMFYGTTGYFLNYSPTKEDKENINLGDNLVCGRITLNNVYFDKKSHIIFLKFAHQHIKELTNKDVIKIYLKGTLKGKKTQGVTYVAKITDFMPINYPVYSGHIVKEFEPESFVGFEF